MPRARQSLVGCLPRYTPEAWKQPMLMFHNGPGFPQGSNFSEPSSCINSTCNNMTSMTPGCLTWASWLIKQLLLQVVWRIHRVYHSILDGLDGLHYIAVLPGMTKAISHVDFGALTPSAICAVMCSDVQCTQASILSISLW